MAFVRETVQRIEQTAAGPDVLFLLEAQFLRDRISGFEPDAPDIVCQPIRVFLYDLQAFVAVGLPDLRSMGRGDIVALQEEHNVFDLFLLGP